MILVDTSVWVDHLARGVERMTAILEEGDIATHPFIIGELACGHIRNRREIFDLLGTLTLAPVATHTEVLTLIERHRLWGAGLGYVDVHLLGSAMLAGDIRLWTRDQRLRVAASSLRLPLEPD